MYSDEKNFLSVSLSDLSTCDHFADDLKHFRIKNLNKIIIAKININYVRNKFDLLLLNLKGNIDIMLITETKTFPNNYLKVIQNHLDLIEINMEVISLFLSETIFHVMY